jgi:thiol-disulfide isomerase/thioredoxin
MVLNKDVLDEISYDEKIYKNKYLKYKFKYLNHINHVGGGNKKDVILFKADWCTHCKNFLPIWNNIQSNHDLKNINFITYDADVNKNEIDVFKISGFPTLLMKNGTQLLEYSGDRDIASVTAFISSN